MGSVTYDFLSESLFFNENAIKSKFKNESDSRIQIELENYRNHCIENHSKLINEIKEKNSFLKVFSSSDQIPFNLLKQTALYIDQFIIYDPLFKHSDSPSEMAKATSKYLGYCNKKLDRNNILDAIKFLKEITPMIDANYVKIFPLSYFFEAPKSIPINLPIDYYNNILPQTILDFFQKNAIVRSMKKSKNVGWIIDEKELYPCRGIAINFREADLQSLFIYHLFETKILDFNELTRETKFRQYIPDTPPDIDYFNVWVRQSVNGAAKSFFDRIFNESFMASNLNSTYLCNSTFVNDLLKRNFKNDNDTISKYTATQVMNLELPFLDNIDTKKLMDIRKHEENIFTNFRIELERNFRELRTENDRNILKNKSENIFHQLNEVEGNKIKTKIEQLKKQISATTTIGVAGLASSIHTAGFSLLATAVALGKGYLDFLKYSNEVKNNPAYLLWKIKKNK